MAGHFRQLLDATIQHLEILRSQGVKFVDVSPGTLAALAAPPPCREPGVAAATTERGDRQRQPAPAQPPRPDSGPSRSLVGAVASAPAAAEAPRSPFAEILSGPRASSLTPEARAAAMTELRGRTLACRKCAHLAASRQTVVFGVGDPRARLMFVGEAPGADEDRQGEPFVGRAGQLLTRVIQAMGFTRETVYIANILKCRPDTPDQASGNRKPTGVEMQTCLPYLLEQIDLIQPRVIVALGGTAVEGLLGKTAGITRVRGTWLAFRDIPLMPTFHPSFLLRPENAGKKRLVWEDMLQVLERLGEPISDKQRNYFLRS
ncbi:MAG: uracil-DNA glycosylase [Verrucomicrobia bacterium]|nr:uracil-DNA glycosylase [Verrucomicrobiota bacterium]